MSSKNIFHIAFRPQSLLLLLCLVSAEPACRAEEAETTGAVFLNQVYGARAAALGGAMSGVAEDGQAIFSNPAGLARLPQKELQLSHNEWYLGLRSEALAFCGPLTPQDGMGIQAFFSYLNGLEKTEGPASGSGSFGIYQGYIGAAWGHAFSPSLSAGAGVKAVTEGIDVYSGWTAAADLGVFASELLPGLTGGVTLKHLGPPLRLRQSGDPLPASLGLGVGYRGFSPRLLLVAELEKPWTRDLIGKAGLEYNFQDLIIFRGGYVVSALGGGLSPANNLSLGLGVEISDYKIDYTFQPGAELGNLHRVSLTFPFGRSLAEEEKNVRRLEAKVKERQDKIAATYWEQAEVQYQHGDYESALTGFTKLLALQPMYPGVHERMAKIENRVKVQKAEKYFSQAQRAYEAGDYLTSVLEWNKVQEILPNYKETSRWLSQANQKLILEKNPKAGVKKADSRAYLFDQGLEAFKAGRYTAALRSWQNLLMLDPGNAQVKKYLQLARTKMEQEIQELAEEAQTHWAAEEWVEAVRNWRSILKINPAHPAGLEPLASHAAKLGELASQLVMRSVEAYASNNLNDAVANLKDALVLEPENPKALKNLKHVQDKLKELSNFQQ